MSGLSNSVDMHPSAAQRRLTVPWFTVALLAVLMAFADGFWMTSLRGAVGAIERTDGPFVSWLRESTLVLPVFVFAVLGALTLALRWFGPELRKPRTIVAAALMTVVAGTLIGIAEVGASSAYDYHLQSSQLQVMDSMRTTCTGICATQQQQASLGLQLRAVAFGSGILLVTNLVLVGWAVAIRGGRLDVCSTRPQGATDADNAVHRSRFDDLRLLLAVGLVASAVVHTAVVPEHLAEWGGAAAFFVVLAMAELVTAGLVLARPQPEVLFAAAAVSTIPLVLWLYSRTVGMPFGPGAGLTERVGLADCAACILEISTLLVAVILLRRRRWLEQRASASAHVSWLALVAVIAVAAIGLAGSGLGWLDDFGTAGDQQEMHAESIASTHA